MRAAARKPSLRERQTDVTRDAVVDALIELLEEDGVFEFSFFALARRAGISVRTIYRYFPTKESLFDAVSARVNERVGFREYPKTREEVVALVRGLFSAFDREAGLIMAQIKTGLGRQVRAHAQRLRFEAIVRTVATAAPALSVARSRELAAAIACLMSADAWLRLRTVAGMSGEQSGAALAWAIDVIFEGIEHENQEISKQAKRKDTRRGRTR
jgi:AcrR family transcriptional regulator